MLFLSDGGGTDFLYLRFCVLCRELCTYGEDCLIELQGLLAELIKHLLDVLEPAFFILRTDLNLIDEFGMGECALALIDFLLFAAERFGGGDHEKLM